ncbi:hypothetical protein ACN20G_29990 (plasmid) [Streptomyces sp. BI20]|uniref:hypothetical protein n=1 Tax=Streptomyces sp. BI20 TaxID=3403460 RepID=UPI003C7076DF
MTDHYDIDTSPLSALFDDPEEDSEGAWAIANGFGFFEDDDTFLRTRKGGRYDINYL